MENETINGIDKVRFINILKNIIGSETINKYFGKRPKFK